MANSKYLVVILTLLFCASCHRDVKPNRIAEVDPLRSIKTEELFQRGVAFAQRGDIVRAEQYITTARDRGYPESKAVPWLVRIAISSARYNSALSHAEPYLIRHPADWSLRFVVGCIYDALDNPDRAKTELERVVGDAPQEPLPHYRLAILYAERFQDFEVATRHFERYLELEPHGAHAEEVASRLEHSEQLDAIEGPKRVEYPEPSEMQ